MRPCHVLFICVQGYGHVYPALGVAAELAGRGHRVSFVATSLFRDAIEEADVRFVPYRSEFETFHVPDVIGREDAEEQLHLVYVRENVAILRAAEEAFGSDVPDVIVYDVFPFIAGRLLAARWGRPAVRTSPVFAANEHYSIWEDLRRSQGFQLLEDVEAPRHAMLALLREYGVRSGIREFWDAVENLNIVFIPRSFQVAGDTFDDRFVFVGPSYPKPRFDADWRPPADGSPVVLISLGTQFNDRPEFFRACAEALAGTEWHAVMAIGAALDPASLEPLPPNVEAHQWVPFVRVLEHATVFMTHGTTGAVMDGLYWGLPLAILPDVAAEAAPSADRVVDLGLGHRLRAEDIGAGRLDAALRRLAGDSAVRERVRLMQDDVRRAGGPLRAADAIEAYVRNPTARAAFSG